MNFLTAGESHGSQLTGILEGFPAGVVLDIEKINQQLKARQGGYGRGNRQKIEHDMIQIVGGIRHQKTLGSPIALTIKNIDNSHWAKIMDPLAAETPQNTLRKVTRPRPGHADLVGGMKYGHRDLRNVLERSSARETAMRVAIGSICKQLLSQLDINIIGYVEQIGSVKALGDRPLNVKDIEDKIVQNDLRIIDNEKIDEIHKLIDETKINGNTLGGIIRVVVTNLPAGLGSYTSWNTKLDAKLAAAVMGVNAMKGVSIGDGFEIAKQYGSQVMDSIDWNKEDGWSRTSDNLGGFEGGMTNGMPVVVFAAMKPIPTLYKALQSVNIDNHLQQKANVERSDTTAIVPASIVIESVIAIELVKEILNTFEGSNITRLKKQIEDYRKEISEF